MLPPPPKQDTVVDDDSVTNPTRVNVRAMTGEAPPAGLPAIPGYEVLDRLGQGGMGRVFKARHVGLRRLDAIKMVAVGAHQGVIARFMEEARAVARLKHQNIAQVYDSGEVDGHPYFAMELCEAGTLATKLAGQPQDAKWSAQLIMTLAQAMEYCHQQGIIHRDLKPSNILLSPESSVLSAEKNTSKDKVWSDVVPKIADFGLVKQLGNDSQNTQTGDIIGTPSYMAPEQASGMVKKVGPGSDIYALGAILYECLTGRPPFKTPDGMQTLMLVISSDPVPASQLVPRLPRDLNTICMKCLEKQPGRRYLTAQALAEDLKRYLDGESIAARPVGRVEKAWKWCRRRPAWAALIALAVLSLVGFAVGYVQLTYAYTELNKAKRESDLQFQATRAVLDRLIVRYSDDLAGIPQTETIRQKGLDDARRMYERLLKNKPNDETARAQYVDACLQLASIERSMGAYDRAEKAYQRAIEMLDHLVRESNNLDHQSNYLTVLVALTNMEHDQGQKDKGKKYLEQAEPFVQRLKGEVLTAESAKSLGNYYGSLGQSQRMFQQHPLAEAAYRQAVEYYGKSMKLAAEDTTNQEGLAMAHNSLGTSLLVQGKLEESSAEFKKAQDLLPKETHPRLMNTLAMICSNQAIVHDSLKQMAEADAAYNKASAIFKQLMNDFPMIPDYRYRWCKSRVNLVRSLLPRGEYRKAPEVIAEVEPVLAQLVRDYPQQKLYQDQAKQLENCKAVLEEIERGKK